MNTFEKVAILEEFQRSDISLPEDILRRFMYHNDLGLPLSISVRYGLAVLTEKGESVIEETWVQFCNMLHLPPDFEYTGLNDCIERAR